VEEEEEGSKIGKVQQEGPWLDVEKNSGISHLGDLFTPDICDCSPAAAVISCVPTLPGSVLYFDRMVCVSQLSDAVTKYLRKTPGKKGKIYFG
jgi:hypothetical protein